ncbi:MAG TPA: BatA domain-containing protein [Puia sp.]|nr:BatA domain-containing protein [Puia sp.]
MLHLLQPIWLFAIAGVIVPVAIHLWNDRRGKVLAIGSIVFLEKTSLKQARSRKISEWLLLLLRCILLILLAFLLAGPYWKKPPGPAKKGWVLMGPAGGNVRSMADSLLNAGYERHDLKDSCWWKAFASLDRQAPEGVPFYVFTDGFLRHFAGGRPLTARPVYWYVDKAKDSTVRWVDKRWSVGVDSIRVITGSSGPTGSIYGYQDRLREAGDSVDTTTLHVAVYADSMDGRWVTAAVRAVQQFTRRNIIATSYEPRAASRGAPAADWVFWLSSEPLPEGVKAENILLYEPGKATPVDTWIRGTDIKVEKATERLEAAGKLQPIWMDGFGRPLLGLEETAGEKRYHFFSRFNPDWNELVWSADFPYLLQTLLLGSTGNTHDLRMIDPAQVLPGKRRAANEVTSPNEVSIDLAPAGWFLVWLVLLCERLVAFKRQKDSANG